LISVFSGILLAFSVAAFYPFIGSKTWGVMYSNFQPLVILMSITCFNFLRTIQINSSVLKRMIDKVAPLSLGIYLVHPFLLDRLAQYGLDGFTLHPMIGIPITFGTALTLSILSIAIITRIPWVKRIV
jgi:surface polysaccharide O-acyltransferase-like enzyme